jgi:hypothetical protein
VTALTYDGLYGGEAAADPGAAVRTARFVVPRGTTPSAPLSVPFVAAAVQVDNPSGQWYSINGRRVPPWTVSAVVQLDTPSAQLTVVASTPSGHISEAAGEDMVLVATEQRLAPFPGIYTPPLTAFAYRSARVGFNATETGSGPVALGVSAVGLRVVPVRLSVFAQVGGAGGGPWDIRTAIFVTWQPASGAFSLATQGLAPEHPADVLDTEPGAFTGFIGLNEEIVVWGATAIGGGAQSLVAQLQYFLAAP